MRTTFDSQLAQLENELIEMGALCEENISIAAKSLFTKDSTLAENAAALGNEIESRGLRIETLCLRLLLRQQPVAGDLRQISAALRMITDLSRIGGMAAEVASIAEDFCGEMGLECGYIGGMAKTAAKMVTQNIDAFVRHDLALAESAAALDDEVDALFDKTKQSLIGIIAENPENGGFALDLLLTAKYFERIGDHSVNVSDWVAFSITGIHKGETEL